MYSAEELDIPGIIAKNPLTTLINWEGKRGVEAHELNFGAAPAATTAAADDDCATAAETYGEDVDADGAEEEAAAEYEAGLVAVDDEEEAAAEHEAGLVAVDVEDKAVTEEVGKLPSFILDDPSCMGTPVYVARLVKLIGQSKEVKKTVARTGAGGGRVANLPASGVVQVLPSTPTGDPMADDNITVVSAITHWHLSKYLRNRLQRSLKWPHFGVPMVRTPLSQAWRRASFLTQGRLQMYGRSWQPLRLASSILLVP